MKICLVGGIFDREEGFRAKHAITPETTLLAGLQGAGVDVRAVGHSQFVPSEEYDVVHVHHLGKAALKMAASGMRARFVFTGHNGPVITGYEPSLLRKCAFKYVVGKADAVVALSQAEARYLATLRAGHKVRVIANGIPAEVFRGSGASGPCTNRRRDRDRYVILYVGQLIALKGVGVLLRAFQQLRRRWNVGLRLVYHNAHMEKVYKQEARDLGLAADIDFIGILGGDALTEQYRQADLLVLPSFAEALPSVVTEALLCGTPVVASAVGGIPEQVDKYGRVVPPGDVGALATAMDAVLRDLPHFRAMTDEMRRYAEARFSTQVMVESHLALYGELAAGRKETSSSRDAVLDAVVRAAVRAYWFRSRRPSGRAEACVPAGCSS